MDPDVFAILRAYPQIYFACHEEHRTRERSAHGLTGREAGVLTHIDVAEGIGAGELARHLGVAASSLSATLKRLAGLGLIEDAPSDDARRRRVRLTDGGRAALAEDSVLDAGRVAGVLALLEPGDRARAVEGLALLAQAARRYREG